MEELTQDGAQLARTMLMAAAQLAESMARVQAQRAWVAQSLSTAQAAQAQQQIAAERDAARLIFRPLTDDRYWQAPSLDRVVKAYMTASSWAEHDPEALAALQLIKQHAEERWGRVVADVMHESAGTGHVPDRAETTFVEGITRQGAARPDRLVDRRMSSGGPTVDEARVARRESKPAIAQPIQHSLRAGHSSGGKLPGSGTVAADRFTKAPGGHNRTRSGRRDGPQPGHPPGLG